ncbi:deubiquitination-protection protein dph1 [Lodderomyces elongisporus NRRL YB-4239]|uniref:Deubiquitination-protection protein dph1 n=1 Tax=Lodderomyces elongisporus (strain ATCC 11503 / CBS 2605 / JCM 1781 / NBRC 1676 / NRRL YB-4239) TaxID=379508 RepID=A5DY87_LODEL|nr:deubiquitination-protection protein dph1 [Lodderomyces elongisporus NRRL YB-4239]
MSDITITIKSSGDQKFEVTFDPKITVLELKELIATKSSTPAASQRLIYSGKVLKDDQTVESYKVQNSHTVHLVRSSTASSSSSSTASTAAAAAAAASAPQQQQQSSTNAASASVPSNIAAGQGAFNPLSDLTGARYAGYTQLPSASMFGPDGGMNSNLPNPEQMNEMMSNPLFQEQMNAMLSNPQMLDFMIQQSPQLRALGPQAREMLQSPFFRQMLTNPEMMRTAMQMGQQGGAGLGGGNIFGGANAAPSFPAPGANPTTEGANASGDDNGNGNTNSLATTTGTAGTNSANPAANPFASLFPNGVPPIDPMSFFGGGAGAGAGAGAAAAPPQDNRPPEERYESQLRQLNDMGFFDFDRNVEALRRTGGSVQGAIEYLLSHT